MELRDLEILKARPKPLDGGVGVSFWGGRLNKKWGGGGVKVDCFFG